MKNLKKYEGEIHHSIEIAGSKSESNRLLILQKLYPGIKIENLSDCDDTFLMQKALKSEESKINVGQSGTAMRFLTSYFAIKNKSDIVLDGSERMRQRPIKILIDALRNLGANIEYLEREHYPPLRIKGTEIKGGEIDMDGTVSSQYISSILLIANHSKNGLILHFKEGITSRPYIDMTLGLLNKLNIKSSFENNTLIIAGNQKVIPVLFKVESDWSSASYWYSFVALSKIGKITMSSYKERSLQGDAILAECYKKFGVITNFSEDTSSIFVEKIKNFKTPDYVEFDLKKTPDIAQTIIVTAFGLGIGCHLKGLHTLKIKETDRIIALYNELNKLGAQVDYTNTSLRISPFDGEINKDVLINTYGDHRMSMSFAPLMLKTSLRIENPKVVSKSYPNFWNDLKKIQ